VSERPLCGLQVRNGDGCTIEAFLAFAASTVLVPFSNMAELLTSFCGRQDQINVSTKAPVDIKFVLYISKVK